MGPLKPLLTNSGNRPSFTPAAPPDEGPYVAAASAVEAGRYLVRMGSCDDCHTPGWMETNGNVPDAERLLGSPVGFRGPWGTTYPANLRLVVQSYTEDAFVARVKSGVGLPPMPWMNVSHFSDRDLRAIYAFLRSLGAAGEQAPAAVPPGVAPKTPYISFEPVMP